jgi:sugar phosphate isomerase/epimerase
MGRPRNHLPSNEKFRLGSVEVPGLRRPGLRLLLRQQSPATFIECPAAVPGARGHPMPLCLCGGHRRRLELALAHLTPPQRPPCAVANAAAAGSRAMVTTPWTFSAFADEAGAPVEEQIDALVAAGMSYVDLRGVDGTSIVELPIDEARRVEAKLSAAGIRVCMFGSPIGKIDVTDDLQIDLGRLDHLAKLAPIFRTNKVRMFSYLNKTGMPADQFREVAVGRVRQLKERAAALGLALYHENEKDIFGEQLHNTKYLLEQLRDQDTFFGIFDFSNYNQAGDDVWENWLALRDLTDAMHLKDSDATGQHTPLGQGAGFCQRILNDAVSRGWSGPVVLEPHLKNSKAVCWLCLGVAHTPNMLISTGVLFNTWFCGGEGVLSDEEPPAARC